MYETPLIKNPKRLLDINFDSNLKLKKYLTSTCQKTDSTPNDLSEVATGGVL